MSWETTGLWKALARRRRPGDNELRAAVRVVMPQLEREVGQEADPEHAPTWHDPDHALSVAEWISKLLLPKGLRALSSQELALLLLGSYGHDIGNAPEVSGAAAHYRYLSSGDRALLSRQEQNDLQAWLDRRERGLEPPLEDAGAESEKRARLLVADYLRDRHVDLGDRWLRANIAPSLRESGFDVLAEGLVRLCANHRGGLTDSLAPDLDPSFLERGEVIVHHRFLVCVLRVADALSLDPERIPDVLTRSRDGSVRSALEWRSSPRLTLSLEDNGRTVATGRPRSAEEQNAIEQTIETIESQLRLAADIDAVSPFAKASRRNRRLPHRWRMDPVVDRDLRPDEDRFVYVNGAFRPNTKKLLELLGGQDLYGSPLMALRELLQNSYDAVRERIAWQRLMLVDPADESAAEQLKSLLAVSLELTEREGRQWLIARDSGAGMSRDIITNYFLVSGSSRPPELHALGRRSREAGFHLERSGRFGIGVLSYFMLADRVELLTRRCHEAPSGEMNGWSFSTEGVGSFGELRRTEGCGEGTEVALRIRDGMQEEVMKFREAVRLFVRRAPCETSFVEDAETTLTLPQGWARSEQDLTDTFVDSFLPEATEPKRTEGKRERAWREGWETLQDSVGDFRERIRWSTETGSVGDGAAFYRVSVPYFELEEGRSLAYLRLQRDPDDGTLRLGRLGQGEVLLPRFETQESHDGLSLRDPEPDPEEDHHSWERPFQLDIDWVSGISPETVRRTSIHRDADVEAARKEIDEKVAEAVAAVLSGDPGSPFARLSRKVAHWHITRPDEFLERSPRDARWALFSDRDQATLEWRALSAPAVDGYADFPLQLRGRQVHRLATIAHRAGSLVSPNHWWDPSEHPVELCLGAAGRAFAQVFDVSSQGQTEENALGCARFPRGARGLIAVRLNLRQIFNRDHPLFLNQDDSIREEWQKRLQERVPLDEQIKLLLEHPEQLPSWFCTLLRPRELLHSFRDSGPPRVNDYWAALLERDSEVPRLLFDLAAPEEGDPRRVLVFDQARLDECKLITFSEEGYEEQEVDKASDVWQIDPDDQLQRHQT